MYVANSNNNDVYGSFCKLRTEAILQQLFGSKKKSILGFTTKSILVSF